MTICEQDVSVSFMKNAVEYLQSSAVYYLACHEQQWRLLCLACNYFPVGITMVGKHNAHFGVLLLAVVSIFPLEERIYLSSQP